MLTIVEIKNGPDKRRKERGPGHKDYQGRMIVYGLNIDANEQNRCDGYHKIVLKLSVYYDSVNLITLV